MPDRLLSAAACAEIAARAAEADERHELVVCISLTELRGALATIAALREALEPLAQWGDERGMEIEPDELGRAVTLKAQQPHDPEGDIAYAGGDVKPMTWGDLRRAAAVYEATGP